MIKRSVTETIVAAMEEVDKAVEVLIIMTSEDGSIINLSSTDVISTKLGLLEMTKSLFLKDVIQKDF